MSNVIDITEIIEKLKKNEAPDFPKELDVDVISNQFGALTAQLLSAVTMDNKLADVERMMRYVESLGKLTAETGKLIDFLELERITVETAPALREYMSNLGKAFALFTAFGNITTKLVKELRKQHEQSKA